MQVATEDGVEIPPPAEGSEDVKPEDGGGEASGEQPAQEPQPEPIDPGPYLEPEDTPALIEGKIPQNRFLLNIQVRTELLRSWIFIYWL